MKPKLDSYLVKSCPNLFADRHTSMRHTAMCWGFECGSGWYQLIKEAAFKLEPMIVAYKQKYTHQERNPYYWCGFWWSLKHPILAGRSTCNWILVELGLKEPAPWWPRATQVKEKYGTLRFYLSGGTEEMEDVIWEATKKSAVTCEVCGKPGKFRGESWFYTSCEKHMRDS